MVKHFESTIQEIMNDSNPIVRFEDTYRLQEILEEKGFWKSETVKVKNSGFFTTGRPGEKRERTVVAKPHRYRVDHGNGYMTQNDYKVGQVVPEMTDLCDMVLFEYEIQPGTTVIVEHTGRRDLTCPQASFIRAEYRVIDYKDYLGRFRDNLIYMLPSTLDKLTKI